jgi:hypothetical protein
VFAFKALNKGHGAPITPISLAATGEEWNKDQSRDSDVKHVTCEMDYTDYTCFHESSVVESTLEHVTCAVCMSQVWKSV